MQNFREWDCGTPDGNYYLSAFRGLIPVPEAPRPTRYTIARMTAEKHGMTFKEFVRVSRARRVSWARQEAMWLMAKFGYGDSAIAHTLKRTSWTVTHGRLAHGKRLSEARVSQ